MAGMVVVDMEEDMAKDEGRKDGNETYPLPGGGIRVVTTPNAPSRFPISTRCPWGRVVADPAGGRGAARKSPKPADLKLGVTTGLASWIDLIGYTGADADLVAGAVANTLGDADGPSTIERSI